MSTTVRGPNGMAYIRVVKLKDSVRYSLNIRREGRLVYLGRFESLNKATNAALIAVGGKKE